MDLKYQGDFAVSTNTKTSTTKTFLRGANLTLPSPAREYQFGDARFFVYKVKDKSERNFPQKELHTLLLEARKTYLRYGDVALTDSYDEKSSIYLTRIVYHYQVDNVSIPLEEWVSVRFVPASGDPISTEDLDACVYNNRPLSESLHKMLLSDKPEPLKHLVTISRICRIVPRVPVDNVFFSGNFLPQKNKYTALAFTAMNEVFLEESKNRGEEYHYFTALAKPELFEKVLHFQTNTTKVYFPFSPASEILQLKNDERLRIHRSLLSYRHPGYFLHLEEMIALLEKLIELGRLTENSWQHYFQTKMCFAEFRQKHEESPYHEFLPFIQGLSKLLLTPGWIEGSRMHGTELRSLVDLCVSDAVQLYIAPASKWKQGISAISQEFFSPVNAYESQTYLS